MDDRVAVAIHLENGGTFFCLSWGRVHDPVDPHPLAKAVLHARSRFNLPRPALGARVCWSLGEAAAAPYFYECLMAIQAQEIPFGRAYAAWRRHQLIEVNEGRSIWQAGVVDAPTRSELDVGIQEDLSPTKFNHEPPSDTGLWDASRRYWTTDLLKCHVWEWSSSRWAPTFPEVAWLELDCPAHTMAAAGDHWIACEACGCASSVEGGTAE